MFNAFGPSGAAFLVVCLTAACVLSTSDSNAFKQYNATRYLYGNQPSVANWPLLPFTQPVKQVLWWDSAQQFVFLFNETTPMTASVDPATGALFNWQAWNNSVVPYLGVGAVFNGSFYYVALWGPELVVQRCLPNLTCFQMISPDVSDWIPITVVTDIAVVRDGEFVLGSDTALVYGTVRPTNLDLLTIVLHNTTGSVNNTGHYVSKVHVGDDGTIFAATREFHTTSNCWTTDLVHVVDSQTRQELYYYRTPGIIDAIPTAFIEDPLRGALHMGNEICDNVLYHNGTFQRLSGAFEGNLPQRNITSGALNRQTGNVWFGTAFGVEVLQADNSWKYFFGPRWLPAEGFTTGNSVIDLATTTATAPSGDAVEIVVVATDTGVSVVYSLTWHGLDEKAAFYQSNMPRFLRYGLVSQLSLQSFGDTLHFTQGTTANDGLWSSLYLGSQAFRYAATKDPLAQQEAWNTFEGMQMLINVTGDLGYPARSFLQQSPCPQGLYPSTSMPGFCWQGGTSSDEITGHLSAYPILYFLVANTADQKARVAATITNVLSGIVKNNFTLIGAHSDRPTQWGHWGPQDLNDDPFWYDERGVNSNQILSFLVTAYAITENPLFESAFWQLVNHSQYDWNIIDLKITQPSDINYSDDELTFLPYLSFLLGSKMASSGAPNPLYQRIARQVWLSIDRTHGILAKEKPSLYNAIFIGAAQQLAEIPDSDVRIATAAADALWWLRTYTVWQVDWPSNNMGRLDAVFPRNDVGRDGPGSGFDRTLTLFPYDETTMLRWNANPFDTVQGSGYSELDPSPFLYAFWVGRYFRAW